MITAKRTLRPMSKQSLADRVALRIKEMVRDGGYGLGDRLPAIMEMARSFGVGHPTVREALTKLEAVGVVEIRHGSGVYVSRREDALLVSSPGYAPVVTRKLLSDLLRSRMSLEMQSVAEAVEHLTARHLKEMRRLLDTAGRHLEDDAILNKVNMAFHRQIAVASGNSVLLQLLDVLRELFSHEQLMILDIFGSREADHRGHLAILEALERRDVALAVSRMRKHLQGVLDAVQRWDPAKHPVS
ncbi:MAG TPA: FadR/GntR family transcriptional regulator [Gemmatimonadales bacterium]|nr:FadR/GntR family transcriptional regulator [Gemmatimonadales bacterium]